MVKFPPSLLDEIRARLPVSAVVGKRVRLVKAGREWKGLSPFNAEKTPSFYVNDQKGFYHCFSSGKNGDIFTFLMEVDGSTFPEAVERLAAEAGVAMPKTSRETAREEERRKSLHEVMELAAAFFEAGLRGKDGAKARAYLGHRGLQGDIQTRFRLGYAPPERFALRDHLAGKGVASEAMVEAGLLIAAEDVAVPYDRFRDRVIFPIHDVRGRVVAFGGRALAADAQAKYLNSPETPLFHKGSLLYNHHNARRAAHDAGTVVAVEGYVDVISLAAVGIGHVVAPLGTALTEDQLQLLWRMADEPILCFDGDKAGRRAAYRALDVALPHLSPGKSLRFALLPEGQDPDDLARSGGAAGVDRALSAARPLVDMLWGRELEAGPLDTPERRAALERRFADLLQGMRDETLRRYYRAEIDNRLAVLMPDVGRRSRGYERRAQGTGAGRFAPRGRLSAQARAAPQPASPGLMRDALFSGGADGSPREAMILAALLTHPELLARHAEDIAALDFGAREHERLRALLLDLIADNVPAAPAVVERRAARAGLTGALDRVKTLVRPGDAWTLQPEAHTERVEEALRQAITLHRRSRTLHSELKAAETALAEGDNEADLVWLRDVQAQIAAIEGAETDNDQAPGIQPTAFEG